MSDAKSSKRTTKKALLPEYLDNLSQKEAKDRYTQKLEFISGQDPYKIPRNDWSDDIDLWPSVTYIDVGMYLLFSKSPYTEDQLKNYKSLACYQNFANGWMREVLVKAFDENRLVIGKVNHSQRMTEKHLTPWIISEKSGKIIAAHCDCMAGLGESCSHVASLLWAIEAGIKQRDSTTVTEKKAYWVLPTAVKKVSYSRIRDIYFQKKCPNQVPKPQTEVEGKVPPPTASELSSFFSDIHSSSQSKPVILTLIEQFSDPYVPRSLSPDLPAVLSECFNKELSDAAFSTITTVANQKLSLYMVNEDQKRAVEERTRLQSSSRIWVRMRTGRVTASKFKSACHTNPENPSTSLIMSICHPELAKFSTEATKWGCCHEETAKEEYRKFQEAKHNDFKLSESGFFINIPHGFIGATPDSLVCCSCCGEGVCEIKCPFCQKDKDLVASLEDKNFCLEVSQDKTQLKRNHAYYYQVQAQLFCTGRAYCDFILWSKKTLIVERIFPDISFWEKNVEKARAFTLKGLLPELLARWYSRPSPSQQPQGQKRPRSD